MAVQWNDPQDVQSFRQEALQAGFDAGKIDAYIAQHTGSGSSVPNVSSSTIPVVPQTGSSSPSQQQGVLPQTYPITQHMGNYNPNVEIYSRGYARDTNFAAPVGTPTALPPGNWYVESVFANAPASGGPRGVNQGYGNAVKVKNTKTGDSMIFQHLATTKAQQGQQLPGGSIIGTTGASGNATGPNLGIEYQNARGQLQDITRSPYAAYLFGGN